MTRPFRCCGHAPGDLSPDQAVVDAFRAMLAARKNQPADSTSDDHGPEHPDGFAGMEYPRA
ncbi:hypothetical protein ACIQWL_53145 [Streptomyces mirabilis]|uniref:hypothetical protein n=1 Tax=Streptomyces mirabilis TaxID=68239 RepID=UPI000765C743|nr:hypothetical protein [Streptomyces mirabilis]MCX4428792.1 hypothetical protein [Streptomyces mirabilis]